MKPLTDARTTSEPEPARKIRSRDRLLLLAGAAGLLAATAVPFAFYARPPWAGWQAEFREVVTEKLGADRAEVAPTGIQQIWARDLGRTDRCVTCHLGVEWKGLETVEEPFRRHPAEILKKHPIARFGCTICHGGQGWATEEEAAHGYTGDWEEPLLSSHLATEDHMLKKPAALLEMRCNACHRLDRAVEGMPMINHAKDLVAEKGCRACHIVNGRGGVIGPDLSAEGEKESEQFDYSRLGGRPSVFEWHVAHFKQPKQMSPDTIMPDFHFTTEDGQSLALLVMSWRRPEIPLEFLPGAVRKDAPSEKELAVEKAMTGGPGAFFVKNRCFVCHSVSVYGIPETTGIGPDLSNAWEDAQRRFGRTLEDFLKKPSGTMEVVLSRQIILTPEQKEEAIGLLKNAYELYLKAKPAPAEAGKP
jgi:cytochrome c